MDPLPPSSPPQPRTLNLSNRGKGFSYITYSPGTEEKARIEEELKNEVCDKIESSNGYQEVGLSGRNVTRNDLLACISKHIRSLPARYCLDIKADDVVRHMKLLNQPISNDEAAVSCFQGKADGNAVQITVVCCDRPKIYNRITFALDKYISSTLDADIMTTNTGKAFDRILVEILPEYLTDLLTLAKMIKEELERIFVSPQEYQKPSLTAPPPPPRAITTPTTISETDVTLSYADIQLADELSKGLYSITYEGILKPSYDRVMVKVPRFTEEEVNSDHFLQLTQMWKQEVDLMTLVGGGSHICRLIGACLDGTPKMAIVYEHVGKTYLRNLLTDDLHISDDTTPAIQHPIQIAFDIAKALRHLHSLGIIHRDVKSANIIIDSKGKAKLADYSLACFIDNEEDLKPETGTYRYMAPEVIRHESYSLPADVYSFGILLWELTTKAIPFGELSPYDAAFGVAKNNLRPLIPEGVNSKFKALMIRCWHPNPEFRPTFKDICLNLSKMESIFLPGVEQSGV